jgi:hypothetical protein
VEVIRSFVKNYFVFLLLLQITAYLTPKESYQKYLQLFLGALMAVMLLAPVLTWMDGSAALPDYIQWEELMEKIDAIAYEGEGEDMFEIFFMEEAGD